MPLMGVREYARHRGVSHVAVIAAVKAGRITKRKDGKINSRTADRQWEASTDQSKPRNSVTGNPTHRRARGEPETPMGFDDDELHVIEGNGHDPASGDDVSSYMAARTKREKWLAEMAELKYRQAIGELVEAAAVKSAAFETGRAARNLLMTLPARLAPILAGSDEESECYRILDEGIREISDEIARKVGGLGPAKPARKRGARKKATKRKAAKKKTTKKRSGTK